MKVIEKKQRSLIMCVTPLQMIIAEKIINLKSEEDFDVLVIALCDNEKYRYYYNRLKKISLDGMFYSGDVTIRGFLSYIKMIKNEKIDKKYNNLYLASIDSRQFQYVFSKNKNASVYTFDDGTANIIPNDLYYSNAKPKFLKRMIWRSLGVKYYMEDIKKLSLLHYTIYEGVPNIIEKTQLINLYKNNESNITLSNKTIRIYLGQPLEEISPIFTTEYILNILHKLNVGFYYPHPREDIFYLEGVETIISSLVFEDYIINYLNNNPEVEIEVYSFISSAMLNISSLNRVKLNYIYNSYLYNNYKDFYNFANKDFKIDCFQV